MSKEVKNIIALERIIHVEIFKKYDEINENKRLIFIVKKKKRYGAKLLKNIICPLIYFTIILF